MVSYPPSLYVEALWKFKNLCKCFGSERHSHRYDTRDPIRMLDGQIKCSCGSKILPNNDCLQCCHKQPAVKKRDCIAYCYKEYIEIVRGREEDKFDLIQIESNLVNFYGAIFYLRRIFCKYYSN